jgi:MYXO-CTERM domain-containing protein
MKTRSIGVLGAASTAAAMFVASGASADFIGWTSSTRAVTGGFLVNVFAVTNASTDVILNVSGGSVGLPTAGFITTNSSGGFLQGTGAQSVFAPSGSQSWTTLDSFLTVGGGFSTTSGNFTGNSATQGDPPWNVTYFDTDLGEDVTVSSFNTQSNEAGFTNPNVNSIPATAGWFIAGSTSPARSLASLAGIRNGYASAGGINYGSSSQAAADAANGFMVAQLFVSELGGSTFIDWKMSATLRRADGTTSNASFQMRIGDIPAPGALALLGLAGVASRRRRA